MIVLAPQIAAAIEEHGASAFPRECCGVLLGDLDGDSRVVREARPLDNAFAPSLEFEQTVERDADEAVGQERRYLISPDAMFALMREERRTKRKVLGFYHSHPNHPARPSETDRVWAMNWYSYLILSVQNGRPAELTCWRLAVDGAAFEAEEVHR